MSSRLFILLSFVFAFLQGSFLPVVFSEGLLITFLSLSRPTLKVAPFVFLSGLLFDLVQNGRLGATSLLFLVSIFLLSVTREQIQIQKALSLSFVVVAINLIRMVLVTGFISWMDLLISFVASFIFLYLFWHPTGGGKIRIN